MLEVGRSFRDGLGVIPDQRIAAENFWRAAEKGNPEGAYNYAEMLRDGKGVEQDKGKAYVWFSKAAEAGYADAAGQAGMLSGYSARKMNKTASAVKESKGSKNTGKSSKARAGKKHKAKKHRR